MLLFFAKINLFQDFDVSVLMPFHCSFNIGIENGNGRGRPLQLISLQFFESSWMIFVRINFCG